MWRITEDITAAVRAVRRKPATALMVALSIGAGVAGSAAIFAIVDAAVLRGRPGIQDSGTLLEVARTANGACCDNFSLVDLSRITELTHVIDLAAVRLTPEPMRLEDQAGDQVFVGAVGWNYFSILGTRIVLGRPFNALDDTLGAEPVAIVSDHVWRSRFGGRKDVVGHVTSLNGRRATIVGVSEPGFTGHSIAANDVWLPVSHFPAFSDRDKGLLSDSTVVWLQAVGRLRPGVTVEAARDALAAAHSEAARRDSTEKVIRGLTVVSSSRVPEELRAPMWAFIGVVAVGVSLLMVLVCANVAGLLMSRNASRARELGVRLALGASTGTVFRQLLIENVVMSLPGAFGGAVGALWVSRGLEWARPLLPIPIAMSIVVDWRIVVLSGSLALFAAVGSTVVPTLLTSRSSVVGMLAGGARGASEGASWVRTTLMAGQLLLATVLVVGALVLAGSLSAGTRLGAGAFPAGIGVVQVNEAGGAVSGEVRTVTPEQLLESFKRKVAGTDAALTAVVPLTGMSLSLGDVMLPDRTEWLEDRIEWNAVSDGYFRTFGIPILQGRAIDETDGPDGVPAVVLNEELASRLFAEDNPVGRVLRQQTRDGVRELRVVGVARNSKYRSLGEPLRNAGYVAFSQSHPRAWSIAFRQSGAAEQRAIGRPLAEVMADVPGSRYLTMADIASVNMIPQQLALWFAAAFAAVGVSLGAIGVFGVVGQVVERRRREIAIRVALGASRGRIAASVVGPVMATVAASAVGGAALGAVVPQLLSAFVYGIAEGYAYAVVTAAAITACVGLVGTVVPLRAVLASGIAMSLRAD